MNRLEEAMRNQFPGTDLKVNPHIMSKITAWKKSFYSLQGIMSRSGVGFNLRGDYMIECDNDQWEQIVKVDPNARFMRNKPWPLWDDWQEIFGKDRATGNNAEDFMEAVNEVFANEKAGDKVMGGLNDSFSIEDAFQNEPLYEHVPIDTAEDSVCQSEKGKNHVGRSGKKRKGGNGNDVIVDLLHRIHEDTNSRLQGIFNRIGYEVDLNQARKEVYGMLGLILSL